MIFIGNFTPVARSRYRIGVPRRSAYVELLNTDAKEYGGAGMGNLGRVAVDDVPSHGFAQSIELFLPPLSAIWLVPEIEDEDEPTEAPIPPPPERV